MLIYDAYIDTGSIKTHIAINVTEHIFLHGVSCNSSSMWQISEAEKDHFRQQLHMKIQKLSEMQQEAETLEKQLDRQSSELNVAQGERDQLQSLLHTLNAEDIRHVSKNFRHRFCLCGTSIYVAEFIVLLSHLYFLENLN